MGLVSWNKPEIVGFTLLLVQLAIASSLVSNLNKLADAHDLESEAPQNTTICTLDYMTLLPIETADNAERKYEGISAIKQHFEYSLAQTFENVLAQYVQAEEDLRKLIEKLKNSGLMHREDIPQQQTIGLDDSELDESFAFNAYCYLEDLDHARSHSMLTVIKSLKCGNHKEITTSSAVQSKANSKQIFEAIIQPAAKISTPKYCNLPEDHELHVGKENSSRDSTFCSPEPLALPDPMQIFLSISNQIESFVMQSCLKNPFSTEEQAIKDAVEEEKEKLPAPKLSDRCSQNYVVPTCSCTEEALSASEESTPKVDALKNEALTLKEIRTVNERHIFNNHPTEDSEISKADLAPWNIEAAKKLSSAKLQFVNSSGQASVTYKPIESDLQRKNSARGAKIMLPKTEASN